VEGGFLVLCMRGLYRAVVGSSTSVDGIPVWEMGTRLAEGGRDQDQEQNLVLLTMIN
jgi:hypothetical protein